MTVFEHTISTPLLVLALLAAILAGAWSAWRYLPRNRGNIALAALYLLILLAVAWCLLLPGRKEATTQLMKPRFVIALDTSSSMMLSPSEEIPERWTKAMQALDLPWVDVVSDECVVEVFPFSSQVSEAVPLDKARTIDPQGSSTLLRQLERHHRPLLGPECRRCPAAQRRCRHP